MLVVKIDNVATLLTSKAQNIASLKDNGVVLESF